MFSYFICAPHEHAAGCSMLLFSYIPCAHRMQLAALSKAWGFDYFGWMHSDGVVLRKDTSEDIGAVVQSKLQGMGSSSWGVAFTYYDILAFYNTKVRHLRSSALFLGAAMQLASCTRNQI
eukprot:1142191-Pelagomonas_calceolata.AAC.3